MQEANVQVSDKNESSFQHSQEDNDPPQIQKIVDVFDKFFYIQVAPFIFATNFHIHMWIIQNLGRFKFKAELKTTNHHEIRGILFDKVHEFELETYENGFRGLTVSAALEG